MEKIAIPPQPVLAGGMKVLGGATPIPPPRPCLGCTELHMIDSATSDPATATILQHILCKLLEIFVWPLANCRLAGYSVRGTVRSISDIQKVKPVKDLDKHGKLELVEADLNEPKSWPA